MATKIKLPETYTVNGEKVTFSIDQYASNPVVMALTMNHSDGEHSTITVNIGDDFIGNATICPINCAWIDTNNNPGIEQALEAIGAKPYTRFSGPVVAQSGFCTYPLYQFPQELLEAMDPAGYELRSKQYGEEFRKIQRQMNIAMFGFDPFGDDDDEDDEPEDE